MTDEKASTYGHDMALQTGDIVRTVVQDHGDQGDPVCFIDGKVTFIETGPHDNPDFGDTVRVKVADVSDEQVRAVLVGEDG